MPASGKALKRRKGAQPAGWLNRLRPSPPLPKPTSVLHCDGKRWLFAFPLLFSALGFAAVPVEESVGQERSPVEPASEVEVYRVAPLAPVVASPPTAADQSGGVSLGTLFHQIQVLQGELQGLRGMVEEQGFQIQRLARDQKEQYVDLDQRILTLRNSGASPPPAMADTAMAGVSPVRPPPVVRPTTGVSANAKQSEQEYQAYAAAFGLMKGRAFAEAVVGFQKVLTDYPNGQYAPNCYYWLGELFLEQNEIEKARQHFVQVINLYPDHPKVPDALYKLGVTYHRLGDSERTREHLNRVSNDYPDSTASDLAQKYLAELQ